MKKVIAVMVFMFVMMVWPFSGIWYTIFKPIIGGGVEQSYIYPLYGGIILLAGIIVGCTVIIVESIKESKENKE